jgi:hypothetical protein
MSSAKYIIFDNNIPFVVPEFISLSVLHKSILLYNLAELATSSGWCYYDPKGGWKVFTNTKEEDQLPNAPCKQKEDAEILNRHLFI